MYFPALEQLSNYDELDRELLKRIDSTLYLIYSTNHYYKRFGPTIYKYFGFELDEPKWITTLDNLAQYNYLIKNFELCCYFCDETIDVFHSFDDLPVGSEKSCPNCGKNFLIRYKDIFITYSFEDLFKPDSNCKGSPFFRNNMKKSNGIERFSTEDLLYYPKVVFNELLNERKIQLEKILNSISTNKYNDEDKGKIFETLACNLLSSPYLKYHLKNKRTPTGEIDLIFIVNKLPNTLFNEFSNILIVECKNWDSKADAPSIRTFISKMEDANSSVGIFFSRQGITGNYNHSTDGKGVIKNKWIEKNLPFWNLA
jgi:Holliday junction resolvase-like predicted endonuclease